MPIGYYLGDNRAFESADLKVMGEALTGALAKLDLRDRDDAMVEMVARRIIRAALNGERDVSKLTEIGADGGGSSCLPLAFCRSESPPQSRELI